MSQPQRTIERWTTTKPTATGYYWFKAPRSIQPCVVQITQLYDLPLEVFFIGNEKGFDLAKIDGQWQGPITPQEARP
ncbi:MAG TPA: hypothetical protein VEF04_21020 [Blastocatellia bacterium]|nr:hypothetical protein [Blastocatellia bacterium]